jgi:CARDB protein
MKTQHTIGATAAVLTATALIAAPAAGAKAQKQLEADLATQRVTMAQQYVVVKPSGKTTHPISVTVSIRNIGHAAAPPSETDVRLFSNGHKIANETIPLGRLAPGHASTQIALFPDAEPQLGFLEAQVIADSTIKVSGPTNNDVKRSPERPVIAQRWTGVMESDVHTPGILGPTEDDHATTPQELAFTFSRRDAIRFVYTVGGTVDQTATFSGGRSGGCSGSGEGSGAMSRWGGDSGFFISRDLTKYEATVRTSLASPFTVTWTCPDIPVPVTTKIQLKDLLTETSTAGGLVGMTPKQRVLHGRGHLGTMITIDYNWNLVADVP